MNLDLSLYNSSENLWADLEKTLKPWGLDEEPMIKKAFNMASVAHRGQLRKSGIDYIVHPVWVAKVVAQLGVGRRAVVAALLHDTIEDTTVTIDEIAREFDDEVALLVDGLTDVKKLTKGIEVHETNIEVFRRFLFSSVDDVRVLIIRTVDKLHNVLTIDSLTPERQRRYSERVLGIYSPIAEYVGLHYFKRLLDDVAFKILYPNESTELERLLNQRKKDELKAGVLIQEDIKQMLDINNIHEYEIQSRIKSLYSTYIRMKRRKNNDGFLDRVGIRVITNTISDCYTVLGLLHAKYPYLPDEFDDYISNPKPSGYRSIQTTLNWKGKLTVEVQIRTKEMHEFNEFGPASHIAYKMSKSNDSNTGYEWIKELVNWKKGEENVNNYRINVLERYIYVFTPKGDAIQMPKGSTALDFAYRIHGEVGNHCIGAKINQKMGKIDTILKTGDLVEILTSKKVQRNSVK